MCKCLFLIIKSQCFLIFKQLYSVLLQEVGGEGLRAMDQAISPVTLEARGFKPKSVHARFVKGEKTLAEGFTENTSISPVSTFQPKLCNYIP
jgi:hypothetical protein